MLARAKDNCNVIIIGIFLERFLRVSIFLFVNIIVSPWVFDIKSISFRGKPMVSVEKII